MTWMRKTCPPGPSPGHLSVVLLVLGSFCTTSGDTCRAAPVQGSPSQTFDVLQEPSQLEALGIELVVPSTPAPASAAGEDLAEPTVTDQALLGRVVQHMRDAEVYLRENLETVPASAAQARALVSLDEMIEKLTQRKSQCKGGQCKKPSSSKDSPKPSSSAKAGSKPGEVGSETSNASVEIRRLQARTSELVREIWGKLPERQRERILQPMREDFLPEYAEEIEAYFRDLARPDSSQETGR